MIGATLCQMPPPPPPPKAETWSFYCNWSTLHIVCDCVCVCVCAVSRVLRAVLDVVDELIVFTMVSAAAASYYTRSVIFHSIPFWRRRRRRRLWRTPRMQRSLLLRWLLNTLWMNRENNKFIISSTTAENEASKQGNEIVERRVICSSRHQLAVWDASTLQMCHALSTRSSSSSSKQIRRRGGGEGV